MTSSTQQQIVNQAPRLLKYFTLSGQEGLIPDTPKARKWAVEKREASQMGCFAFYYFDSDGMVSSRAVGDCYYIISDKDHSDKDHSCLSQRPALRPSEVDIGFASRVQELLSQTFLVAHPNCRCLYLAPLTVGVSIPSSVFEIEMGSIFLRELHRETGDRLSSFSAGFGLRVAHAWRVDVENARLPVGQFAIPFLLDEVPTFSEPLERLASRPRSAHEVDLDWKVEPGVLADLKRGAMHRWRRRHSRKHALWQQQPKPELLTDTEHALFRASVHATSALRCARKLVDWMIRKKVTEFRQRDAERAVRQPLHGKAGDGGGIADALRILIGACYVRECHVPSMEYLCKRSSPWFLVHPSFHEHG